MTWRQYTRWQITTAFDLASEILVSLVPIDMIWSLQMPTKKKLAVLVRLWIRLPQVLDPSIDGSANFF